MQEMFNKDLEEIKKSQSIINHAITHIKNQYNIVKFKNKIKKKKTLWREQIVE